MVVGRSDISRQTEGAVDELDKLRMEGTPVLRRASGGDVAERELVGDAEDIEDVGGGELADAVERALEEEDAGIVSRRGAVDLWTTVVVTSVVVTAEVARPAGRIGTRVALAFGIMRFVIEARDCWVVLVRPASVIVFWKSVLGGAWKPHRGRFAVGTLSVMMSLPFWSRSASMRSFLSLDESSSILRVCSYSKDCECCQPPEKAAGVIE
jgi:hypothetical protein